MVGKRTQITLNVAFTAICLTLFMYPFLMVIAVSLSDEQTLQLHGYRLIPKALSLEGYRHIFQNPRQLLQAYWITIAQSALGTALSVTIMGLCAYSLSRPNFRWRKELTFFVFFTMLFSGGLIPQYILNTRYLNLGNRFLIHILPTLATAFYVIIMRTFFQGLPNSIIESAKMDGASEIRTFFSIVVPLSKPVIATMALLGLLDRWNNWFLSLIYIRDESLYTLQFLLKRILDDSEFIRNLAAQGLGLSVDLTEFIAPTESMRFAMVVVAAGPMLVVFPFFQRFFVKGMTVGSMKG